MFAADGTLYTEKLKKEDQPLTGISQSLPAEYAHWRQKSGWFLSSQAVSLFGSSITQFAIVWYVTLSTSSGVMIMLSSLCSFLPQILISLFAGVWADRHNRKYLIKMCIRDSKWRWWTNIRTSSSAATAAVPTSRVSPIPS